VLLHPLARPTSTVLRDVELEVPRGEIFGLLGPNGAGKTTLFKILATLVIPDGGGASVLGHDVTEAPARVRSVLAPVLGDERSLYWRLSARENLRLFAALHRLASAEAERRVDELLEEVGLAGTGRKLVGAFSSGMKQRLLLARALLSRPSVLLLDEPTRSLDPVAGREFRRLIRTEIVGGRGITAMLATHSTEEAVDLCDRIGILDEGRLVTRGTAEELARRFGGDRYRLWTDEASAGRIGALLDGRAAGQLRRLEPEEGWSRFELELPGGPEAAADLTGRLVAAGVRVAGLEKVAVSLAELIEGIVREAGREG